jgi:pilus assembly protein CpaB
MENKKAFIISGICFAISLLLISGYVSQREAELTADMGERVPVLVAKRPINEYETIREDMVEVSSVFKKFYQTSAVKDVGDVIGKSAYVPIYEGEQIVLTKLVSQDGKPVLDRQVERNFRAVTIKISPHTGVGRLVRPGDRVDVLAAPNYDVGGVMVFEIKTLVQNVVVLATGKSIQNAVPTRVTKDMMDTLEEEMVREKRKDWGGASRESLETHRPDDDYQTLTLQVSPDDAKRLLYLSHTYGDNRLYFTLRNSADTELAKLDTTLLDDVLGPESDYGRSMKKPPSITPPKERFNDLRGGQAVPVY